MSGDAKPDGGRWRLGRWLSPSTTIDTKPSPPPGIISTPSYNGSFSGELYPPPQPSGYTTPALQPPPPVYTSPAAPPEGSLYPPPPYAPQSPLSGSSHGLGQSFHQVADPTGVYTSGEQPYVQHGPPPPVYTSPAAEPPSPSEGSLYPPQASQSALSGSSHGLGQSFHQVADPTGVYTSNEQPYVQHGSGPYSGRITDESSPSFGSPGSAIQVHVPPDLGYLLHGTLETSIYEAVDLPNMDMFSEKVRLFTHKNLPGPLEKLKTVTRVHGPSSVITSDPYTVVVLAGARAARTRVINNDANPKWNEHFLIPVAHHVFHVVFVVKDQDIMGSQYIGEVRLSAKLLLQGGLIDGWFDLLNKDSGKPSKQGAKLRLSARYIPVEQNVIYTQGVGSVPNTYFPLRKGCRVTLYQDAHVYDNTLQNVVLDGGLPFVHGRCWEETCAAINDAQHLVYIAGWSVWDKVRLVRDGNRPVVEGGDVTLGELLKKKASEGVRVLVLAWDDKSSHDLPFIKTAGLMNTHDEETKRFFKGTGVRCILSPRYGASKTTWFRQKVVGSLYTHHQKTIIVDSGPVGQRRLSSFIGGLDVTGGRWDTPSHFLFASLQNEHKDDFRNKSWEFAPGSGGPREPWHDWHCKIEGHAAYDVLTNFEQRWKKATSRHDDELIDIDRRAGLWSASNRAPDAGDPALSVTGDQDPETWHVQVFRSIDSGSVKGFPTTVDEVHKEKLVWGKSVAIDLSIQMAYINAIRSAQHFIYIENQYFLGSSYNWPDYKTAGANHLIPMELALKVCSKIREGKRFAVYVVVPMWPEGIPSSGACQEILYFQSQTMKMMYAKIAATLREVGPLHAKPTDFLNFYCLGNRETYKPGEFVPVQPPDNNSYHGLSQTNRRMMIYVHAKGMIVDDELVIMGSANINQRSMDGSRDTEIAMGGYQPRHTWLQKNGHPRGQVYGYRMSLWAENLGCLEPVFEDPECLECVHRVNYMAERNWEQYVAPEVTDMRSYLIRYPLKVADDGTITNLPGYVTFPDVGGKIMGSNQPNIPDDLTT